jgi:hypothetical protein
MSTIVLVLTPLILAACVLLMLSGARKRRRTRRFHDPLREPAADDSPTGYVQGVWMLGGADSAAPQHGASHDAGASDGGASSD